jgi:hypothetical protein
MFLSYLIDPCDHTVRKVSDGFDNAATLIGTGDIEVTNLWESLVDADSTVSLIFAPDAVDDTDCQCRLRLTYRGQVTEQVVFGKAVLVACGELPEEIAAQVASESTVATAIDFGDRRSSGMVDWLKQQASNLQRGTVRRVGVGGRGRAATRTGSSK